ncbi:hypothetical protein IKG33_01995 [Candidatus Saccharibacteria bacterium]|nr:hypothetical protein [Candidatus Saccharibacteria bacterium]
MGNFWQVLTTLGAGSASVEAGRAADETKKLNELKMQELEENKRHNQEMLELQKEQLKLASMTDAQKLKYQKQKAKEIDNEKKIEELFGNFDPFDPIVLKAIGASIEKGLFSTAFLQTYLGIGHSVVQAFAVWFEEFEVIEPVSGNKAPRKVLINSLDEYKSAVEEYIKKNL